MAKVSLKEIQSWNDEIYKTLNDHAKEKLQQLGYNNNDVNDIVLNYLRLLRIKSKWNELQELVEEIVELQKLVKEREVTDDDKKRYSKIKQGIFNITKLDYDDFESQILGSIRLPALNYLIYQ